MEYLLYHLNPRNKNTVTGIWVNTWTKMHGSIPDGRCRILVLNLGMNIMPMILFMWLPHSIRSIQHFTFYMRCSFSNRWPDKMSTYIRAWLAMERPNFPEFTIAEQYITSSCRIRYFRYSETFGLFIRIASIIFGFTLGCLTFAD